MIDVDDGIRIRSHLPCTLDEGIATRALVALLVLATDQTIEYEWRRMLALPGVALYQSRLFNDATVNEKTLRECADRITEATDLILPGFRIDWSHWWGFVLAVVIFAVLQSVLTPWAAKVARRNAPARTPA